MLGMGNMRQWLMNISLVGGWFPAAAFAVIAVLSVTLLVSAAVSKRTDAYWLPCCRSALRPCPEWSAMW